MSHFKKLDASIISQYKPSFLPYFWYLMGTYIKCFVKVRSWKFPHVIKILQDTSSISKYDSKILYLYEDFYIKKFSSWYICTVYVNPGLNWLFKLYKISLLKTNKQQDFYIFTRIVRICKYPWIIVQITPNPSIFFLLPGKV